MPYVNGQFQADMPAPASVNALASGAPPMDLTAANSALTADNTGQLPNSNAFTPINRHTGEPYGTRFGAPSNPLAGLPKQGATKPAYAQSTVPMFPDFAQFAAKRDGIDLNDATDQQILGYSKEYAENMLPQALMQAGHKVDPEYLKTLPHNFQYATSQSLPQLRALFKQNTPPPDATTDAPPQWLDYIKSIIGHGISGFGNATAGTIRNVGSPTTLVDTALSLVNPTYLASRLSGGESAVPKNIEDTAQKYAGPIADAVHNAISGTGKNILETESPGYKAKAAEPFFDPKEKLFSDDGSFNTKSINSKGVNGPALFEKIGGSIAEFAPLLAAAYFTHSPLPVIAGGGTMTSEALYNEEKQRIMGMKPDELNKVPAYQALTSHGVNPRTAQSEIAEQSANMQGKLGLVSGAGMGAAAEVPFFRAAAGNLLPRLVSNYIRQAPLFAGLAGGQQAVSTALANKETGEHRNVLSGVPEQMVGAAIGAAPFALARGRGAAVEPRPGGPPPRAGEAPAPTGPAEGASRGPVDTAGAVAQAFEEHPPQAFKTPEEAAQHYENAATVFRGTLEGDGVPPEQIATQMPAFNEAWSRATGHEVPGGAAGAPAPGEVPTPTTPEEQAAVQEAIKSPAEELGLQNHPSEVRAATAADHLSEALRTRITGDLSSQLGRDPTPEEISQHADDLVQTALNQQGINRLLPRAALEEGVLNLLNDSPKAIPHVDDINAAAREAAKNPAQQELGLQEGFDLEPKTGGEGFEEGFKRIADREQADKVIAEQQRKDETAKNQETEDRTAREKKQKEINDAYERRTAEISARADKERETAHATRERETALIAEEEAKADKEKNVLIKKRQKQRNVLAAKKAEAAEQGSEAAKLEPLRKEEGEGTGENAEGLKATKTERAQFQSVEDFYKRFNNVHDVLGAIVNSLSTPGLKRLASKILSNPYLADQLKNEKFRILNPEDKQPKLGEPGEGIGNFRYTRNGKFTRRHAVWGMWEPDHGITMAGAGWRPTSLIDNGLHPVNVLHEIVHASIARLLYAIEQGHITDPHLVDAYHELEGMRQALKENVDVSSDKDVKEIFDYATKDMHEFLSVSLTDPRVQGILKHIKVGLVNAWQKILGIYNKILGGAPEDMPALERIVDLSNRFLEYKPEGYESQGVERKFSQQSERIEKNTPDRVLEAISIKPKPKVSAEETKTSIAQNAPPTTAESLETKIFDKLKPLTHVNERLAAEGKTVAPNQNMDDASRVYQNLAGRASNIVQQKFVGPTITKLAELAKAAGKPVDEFVTHLAAYYMGRRSLEVNERGELENARLKKDAEIARDAVKQRWINGELQDGQYIEELKKVVNAKGAKVSNRSPLFQSGISDQTAYGLITRAKKNGISQETINEFEPLRKQIVEEINKNYNDSGRFSKNDAARRSGLGSKWYVPMSGFGEGRADSEGTGIGAFTREYHAAGGRETIAANPIVNLLQELQRSARDVPENTLTKTIYNWARKFGKDAGVKIRTLDVEKAIQDAHASGKGLDEIARLFKNENSIVHNAGNFRYSMEFPANSPVLKALKGINDTPELNTAERVLGTVSNIIARGATTLNPKFLLWNAFWRDMGYVGSQVGADLGPAALSQYLARYWLQGGPLRGRPTYFQGLHPRNVLEREEYAATGRSQFAKSLSEIAKYGGDLSFEHELNKVKNMDSVYEALQKAQNGGNIKDALRTGVRFLDQIGTSDIMTARVAAYETYVDVATKKLGKDATPEQLEQVKKDGALWSRRILDYQQRSDMSRILNIAFPFSRVVLNQTDRLFETFKNDNGTFNYKKIAAFAGIGMMAGAAYYSLLRQAHPDTKKQENSTLAQNFLIPVNGNLVKIPMAYGLTRLMLVPGMMAARAAYGDSSKEDAVNEIRNVVMEGVLPFKPPEAKHNEKLWDEIADLGTALTPGAVRPFVELGRNESIFGSPITPNDEYTKGPHAEAGRHATPEFWKDAAQVLRTLTGGAIDVYPESLEYLTQAYGTGIGNGFMRVAAAASRAERGQETNLQQLPFVPSVTSRDAEFYTGGELRNHQQDLEAKGENITDQEREDLRHIRSINMRYGKQLSAVDKNKLLSPDSKQKQIDSILAQKKAEQQSLLKELEARHAK